MKTKRIYPLNLLFILLLTGSFIACDEESYNVPAASTQADFSYEVETIVVDEELGIENFRVKLYNESLQAESYQWDFGNGETSTEENPTVTYTEPGRYTITLSVTSENDLYYNNLQKSTTLALGKQQLFFEDFAAGIDYVDEDTWVPEGWKGIDNDGDGYNWYPGVRDDIVSMRSQSFAGGAALTPDNWLIFPEIDLTDISSESTITFRYTVGVSANTLIYREENYGIFIAVGNDNLDSFEKLLEESMTQDTPRWTPLEREVDISAYAGEVVFLAIRHYNVTDKDVIFFSEVEVFMIQ